MKKKVHGERNKELSKSLQKGKKYYDWVITIAFYSAIHFVEDKILPKKIGNVHYKNINDVKQAYQMSGRHQARERLVSENLSLPIAVKYKWLDDMSRIPIGINLHIVADFPIPTIISIPGKTPMHS